MGPQAFSLTAMLYYSAWPPCCTMQTGTVHDELGWIPDMYSLCRLVECMPNWVWFQTCTVCADLWSAWWIGLDSRHVQSVQTGGMHDEMGWILDMYNLCRLVERMMNWVEFQTCTVLSFSRYVSEREIQDHGCIPHEAVYAAEWPRVFV